MELKVSKGNPIGEKALESQDRLREWMISVLYNLKQRKKKYLPESCSIKS